MYIAFIDSTESISRDAILFLFKETASSPKLYDHQFKSNCYCVFQLPKSLSVPDWKLKISRVSSLSSSLVFEKQKVSRF